MKILKIFGSVVGIHVFALVLIFANPGCSSTSKQLPAPSDTMAAAPPPPSVSVPGTLPSVYAPTNEPAPITFNPDAPATAGSTSMGSGGMRVTPTRPGSPVATVLVAEPVPDVMPATTYTVKSGDSLWSIAKKNHVTITELSTANGLRANAVLRPGTKLRMPGKPAAPVAAAQATGATGPSPKAVEAPVSASRGTGEGIKHVVKSGETLGTIARKYDVKQADIAVANNIADPAKINAGTELIIPGWRTPSGKSSKSTQKSSSSQKALQPAATVEPEPAQPPPPPPIPLIPVIRLDDSPITPAPASKP